MSMERMDKSHVDSLGENCWWDVVDYSTILELDDVALLLDKLNPQLHSDNVITLQGNDSAEREGPSKRGRSNPYVRMGAKASRERMRREKLNDRFLELSAVLEPENPVKTEKLAILVDAIRSLKQLKAESHKYVEMNTKLSEEIKNLKAEKIELREEKLTLKADKERIEQHLKSMFVPPTGFMPGNSAVFQVEAKKMQMIPSYGFVPMWHYLPPLTQDTSQDHQLRPPAA